MKHSNKIKSLLLAFFVSISLFSGSLRAQGTLTPLCDTCTAPWGPVIQKIYPNQTVNGLGPCLFTVYVDIQTRICNGKVQIRLVDHSIVSQCDTCGPCLLSCYNVGPIMEKISKLLLIEYGGNIILSKPSACYYLLEYNLSPGLRTCLGAEAGYFTHWYAVLPCDPNGCCVTEYILQSDGSVRTITSVSAPCTSAPPPVPTTITVYCWSGGVRTAYVVTVVPPSIPLTCEIACSSPGSVFSRTTGIAEKELVHGNIIYPNPASDEIYISEDTRWEQLLIMDMQGKTIQEQKYTGKAINVKHLAAGSYIILLKDTEGAQQKHLLIKK
ncbi:MAG TPA: T9SS type A sorting domain-containing protein [Chitinophagaceae bacterium]|nr:T9SS type A sorting domain-containing protein [Chitinophagaceae bacterium]